MKRIVICLFACLSIGLLLNSCSKEESIDETLLYGTWKQVDGIDNLYYTYNAGGTGKYWYNDQPVELRRDIAWELEGSSFIIRHKSNDGTWESPENYTITSLTSTTLKLRDDADGGKEYVQTKVSK